MTIWKKAVSTVLTASLLASLLTAAFAGTVSAALSAGAITPTFIQPDGSGVTVTPVLITASAIADIPISTLTLTLPTGFSFATTVNITTTEGGPAGLVVADDSPATTIGGTTATFAVSGAAVVASTLLFGSFSVRSETPGLSGNIVLTSSGTMNPTSLVVATVITRITVSVSPAEAVPADGDSTAVLTFTTDPSAVSYTTDVRNITVRTTAGRFTSTNSGNFVINLAQTEATVTYPFNLDSGDTLTLTSPTTAGTATITVRLTPIAGGVAITDSTTTITFFAAGTSPVSATTSTTTVTPTSGAASPAGADLGDIVTLVKTSAGVVITSGVTVTWTISPIGTLAAFAPTLSDSISPYTADVFSTGIAGAATITTTITHTATGVPTTLSAKTFTFVGPLASLTLSNNNFSLPTGTAGTAALKVVAKDAAGNLLSGITLDPVVTPPAPLTGVTFSGATVTNGSATVNTACGTTAGTASVTVKVGSVVSNAVSITCAGAASTFTVSAASSTVAPNGSVAITVDVKDAGGFPAPDGTLPATQTLVIAVTNGVGAVFSSTGGSAAPTVNGKATFTYLAPSNAGSGTVTAFVGSLASQSVTLTIGGGLVVVGGSAASALGVTTSGPFSITTKVAGLGKYVTFKLSGGALAAGQTVTILRATKTGTTWSAFTAVTKRIANSNGDVYYYVRSSSAAWQSFRGQLFTFLTPARQARWL